LNFQTKESIHYQTVMQTNEYVSEINNEITLIHKFVKDLYYEKLPELESLVFSPLEYVKTVKKIANIDDVTNVDLSAILPRNTIMAIHVTSSTTSGKSLSQSDLEKVMEGCDDVLKLDAIKREIFEFVESKMELIAPNLSNLIGSSLAAKLIATVGGVVALSKIPASNVMVIGAQKKALHGFSAANAGHHRGMLIECDLVKMAPPEFQVKHLRMVATKTVLAARVDAYNQSPTGEEGRKLRKGIEDRSEKVMAKPEAKTKKALPTPDEKPRKRRGGKRMRNLKAKYAMTEVRKWANRMKFGEDAQQEFRETGHGFGMLGKDGSGKVRITKKAQKILPNKKQKIIPGTVTSGLASLAFTPVQGIELMNPDIHVRKPTQPNTSGNYFNEKSGFQTVISEKQKQ